MIYRKRPLFSLFVMPFYKFCIDVNVDFCSLYTHTSVISVFFYFTAIFPYKRLFSMVYNESPITLLEPWIVVGLTLMGL